MKSNTSGTTEINEMIYKSVAAGSCSHKLCVELSKIILPIKTKAEDAKKSNEVVELIRIPIPNAVRWNKIKKGLDNPPVEATSICTMNDVRKSNNHLISFRTKAWSKR